MNFIQPLVQNPREMGSPTLREEIGALYTVGYLRTQAVARAGSIRQYWFGGDLSDLWATNLWPFAWKPAFGVTDFTQNELDISEIDLTRFEAFAANTVGAYIVAGDPDSYLAYGAADLEAEMAKFVRDIIKAKIENIVGLLGRDYSYHVLDDAIRIVERNPTKPEWALELEKHGQRRPTTQELAGLIRSLKSLLSAGDFWEIDTAFSTLNISNISVEGLIALLRTTYYRRSSLETWTAFLESVRGELNKRGLNAQEVLFGLS
jgi:hypothetical protein